MARCRLLVVAVRAQGLFDEPLFRFRHGGAKVDGRRGVGWRGRDIGRIRRFRAGPRRAEGRGEGIEGDRVDRRLRIAVTVDRACGDVAQLAHIAGPGIAGQRAARSGGEAGEALPAELDGKGAREMGRQQHDVGPARAQRRQRQQLEGQPVQQVLAEPAPGRARRQVHVGGADDAHVDMVRTLPADPLERAILDDAPTARQEEVSRFLDVIRAEVQGIVEGTSIYDLATARRLLVEQYIYLYRALNTPATIISFEDGRSLPFYPATSLVWDDGLGRVRELVAIRAEVPPPRRLELRALEEHRAWESLTGLPQGASDDSIEMEDIKGVLGLPTGVDLAESTLRDILSEASFAKRDSMQRIEKEVG